MTGSGPDELFYGMEKYNLNFFKKLSNLQTSEALEKIDVNYNYEFYKKILNSTGVELLNILMKKRKLLYKKISEINKNFLEAQRILAYCTVTNQHYEMFETVSKCFNLKHSSPFLNKEYIKFALSIKLQNFLNLKLNKSNQNANVGKYQLKKMLSKYTSTEHAFDKKIGFHAPVSKLLNENYIVKNLDKKLNYEKLEKLIDIDRLVLNIRKKNKMNYNIYSLLGLQNMIS